MEKTLEEQSIELANEMKKLNLDIIPISSIDDTKRYLAVEVDIDCEVDMKPLEGMAITKKVMRGSIYYVTFNSIKPGTLTMKIGVELHKDFIEVFKSADFDMLGVIGTTFPDLCWINAEGTTPQTLEEVATKKREGVELGDLTWVLPSKFVDDYVEMMHTLNQGLISGLMQDSIIYGPFIFEKNELVSVI